MFEGEEDAMARGFDEWKSRNVKRDVERSLFR